MTEFERLLEAWFDDELDDESATRFGVLLADDPNLREALLRRGHREAVLREVFAEGGQSQQTHRLRATHRSVRSRSSRAGPGPWRHTPRRRMGRPRTSTAISIGVLLVLAIVVGLIVASWQPDAAHSSRLATVTALTGSATVMTDVSPVVQGQSLAGGDVIAVADGGTLVFTFGDGTHVSVAGGSVLGLSEVNGKRVELERGALSAWIAPQPDGKAMRFVTEHGTCAIVGTRIKLETGALHSIVRVAEGVVEVSDRRGHTAQVLAGQVATMASDEDLRVVGTDDQTPDSTAQQAVGGVRRVLVCVAGDHHGDRAIIAYLERGGWIVQRTDGIPAPASVASADLVLLSGSLDSEMLRADSQALRALQNHPGPMIICEPALLPVFGMSGSESGVDYRTEVARVPVQVARERVDLVDAGVLTWARPSVPAEAMATMPDHADRLVAFTVPPRGPVGARIFLGHLWVSPRLGGEVDPSESGWRLLDTVLTRHLSNPANRP